MHKPYARNCSFDSDRRRYFGISFAGELLAGDRLVVEVDKEGAQVRLEAPDRRHAGGLRHGLALP